MTDDSGTSSDTSIPVSPLNCLYFKLPTAVGLCAGSTVEQQHPALQAAGGRDRSLVGCWETTAQNRKAGNRRLETELGSWPTCYQVVIQQRSPEQPSCAQATRGHSSTSSIVTAR